MITINKNQISNIFFCTLSELQEAPSAEYRFIFTNRATKEVITVDAEDLSAKTNYQKFDIDGAEFDGTNAGLWSYSVIALDSGNPVGNILESGFMNLIKDTIFNPTGYSEQNNQFKAYNG